MTDTTNALRALEAQIKAADPKVVNTWPILGPALWPHLLAALATAQPEAKHCTCRGGWKHADYCPHAQPEAKPEGVERPLARIDFSEYGNVLNILMGADEWRRLFPAGTEFYARQAQGGGEDGR